MGWPTACVILGVLAFGSFAIWCLCYYSVQDTRIRNKDN